MGYYINPKSGDKTRWLNQRGRPVTRTAFIGFDFLDKQFVPVVEVDNGPFTAAGVCYDHSELRAFTDQDDRRPKRYFLVPLDAIKDPDAGIVGLPSLLQRLGVS